MIARLPSRRIVRLIDFFVDVWRLAKSSLLFFHPEELTTVGKYIALIIMLILSTVAVSVAVAVPLANQNTAPAVLVQDSGYMYTLKSNDKDNFIITTLADHRIVRLQLVLELDKSFEPKDLKNPDRQMLILQDSLLRTIRACRSDELTAQHQAAFKSKIADTATQLLGKRAVRSVYVTGLTVH